MMLRHRPLLVLTLVVSAAMMSVYGSSVKAQDEASALDALVAFAAGLQTLAADFEQRTTDGAGFVVDEARGRFSFQSPDRFRWSIVAPFEQELVADGERLWHYDESLDQVTVRDQPAVEDSPILVLIRPELLDQFYTIQASRDPNLLAFSPITDDAEFSQARLRFVANQPVSLELIDRFNQTTVIYFDDLQRNPALPAALFEFEVPEGVDVLEGFESAIGPPTDPNDELDGDRVP
jgi:outer membrane lipoprotein carrier protein